ncbi:MAG: hypothetical protein ACXWKP_01390 [Bradyrhizobium sp.]|jgi:hypothetical protein
MGGFINSQADNEICEVLNKRFSDEVNPNDAQGRTYIAELRDHFQNRENLFDNNHHLHRVFHRLAISVTGGARVPKHNQSRFRWLHFLRSNLCPADTKTAIKSVLSSILGPNSTVEYVSFLTRHVPTTTHTFELFPNNSGVVQTSTDANNKTYCTVALECHTDAALPDSPDETDPPTPDGGETSFAVRRKPLPKKSSAKKSSAKKKKAAGKKKTSTRKAKKGKSRR